MTRPGDRRVRVAIFVSMAVVPVEDEGPLALDVAGAPPAPVVPPAPSPGDPLHAAKSAETIIADHPMPRVILPLGQV